MEHNDADVTTEMLCGVFIGLIPVALLAGGWHRLLNWHWVTLAVCLTLVRIAAWLPTSVQRLAPPTLLFAVAIIGIFVSLVGLLGTKG